MSADRTGLNSQDAGRDDAESIARRRFRELAEARFPTRPVRHLGPRQGKDQRFAASDVAEALMLADGVLSEAARRLGCARSTVAAYLERFPDLEALREEIREWRKDLAESTVFQAIEAGHLGASQWYLDRHAKDRGYTKRIEATGEDGGPIVTLAQLVERVSNGSPGD